LRSGLSSVFASKLKALPSCREMSASRPSTLSLLDALRHVEASTTAVFSPAAFMMLTRRLVSSLWHCDFASTVNLPFFWTT